MNDLIALLVEQGPLVVFAVTLAARLGAPVPAVPFLVVAGGLSVGAGAYLPWVAGAALLGNLLGDGAWFLAGRHWGLGVMRLLCRISLSADSCVKRSETILDRWGGLSLIAAKFVPGVSLVAPPMAGASGMSNRRFLSYETLAALIWTLGFLGLGRLFHGAIQEVLAVLSGIGLVATLVLVIALVAFVGWRYQTRRLARSTAGFDRIDVASLRGALAGDGAPLVIDVRSARERASDDRSIPGALGIPLGMLAERLGSLPIDRDVVTFCDCPDDVSAVVGARILSTGGLTRVRVLAGGLSAWADEDRLSASEPDRMPPGAAAAHAA
ncbi:MAG: VTT domain-containing protein [Gammaproteobacteria bacterium]|nr:VTT domain-containing protein [Gammaproteobacteria bacterium]MBU1441528.1 VTT domain-containing protein [Gammaproteobacteria bacterium]